MAKNHNQDLFHTLRANGVRKKVARTVSQRAGRVTEEQSRVVRTTAQRLHTAADLLEVGNPRTVSSNNAQPTRKKTSKRPATAATKSRRGTTASKRPTRPGGGTKTGRSNRGASNRRRTSSRAGSRSRA